MADDIEPRTWNLPSHKSAPNTCHLINLGSFISTEGLYITEQDEDGWNHHNSIITKEKSE
jgi:hypothetical protein